MHELLQWSKQLNWTGDEAAFERACLRTNDVGLLSRMLQSVPPNNWQAIVTRLEVSLYLPTTPQAQDLHDGQDITTTIKLTGNGIQQHMLSERKQSAFAEEKQARQNGGLRPV